MVRAADVTVCVSQLRALELQERCSRDGRANSPRSARSSDVVPGTATTRPAGRAPADVAHLPRPYLGYIGSLEDRVDWQLMDRISRAFPEASIIVVGRGARPR